MSGSESSSELRALIQLMGEHDESIWAPVRRKLVELGDSATQVLLSAMDANDPLVASRARSVLDDINLDAIENQFTALTAQGLHRDRRHLDLEEGVFLLARFAYPGLEIEPYKDTLDEMADDIQRRLRNHREPDEKIEQVNFHLFEVLGFRGNRENYYEPDNSYINRVLERRLGIPISLSALYLFVTRRLELPVTGIGMPGHFLLKYDAPDYEVYIDAFRSGRLLSKHECAQLLASFGFPFRDEYLEPSSDKEILTRMMRNLVNIYANAGEDRRSARLNRYIEIIETDE